jgi:hypothetical protein
MSAVKEEQPKKVKGSAEVAAFEKKYAEALEDARTSALHTATEGWQQLYQQHKKNVEKRRKEIGAMLHDCATSIERGETSEDLAKVMSESKKQFESMVGLIAMFDRTTIEPVKEAMHRCHEVIEQARREARGLEANSPLVARGVLEAVDAAIKKVEKVTFDEKTGIIDIALD